ncbi:1479_t:CDS:2 [Funneliformis geosporum]|uniref:1479_t:CDS:1 n=1 Tax=Funneliformis geosporum TaxID=1117311 RepID=A0A9W4SFR0_9GLOM|nr:1479_t:CDS:2 [Funneliformis geosporum]
MNKEQVYTNNNIKELDIRDRNLKGELNLRNYQQLEELHCSFNKLTNIILSTNPITYEIRNQDFIPTSLKKLDLRTGIKQLTEIEYLQGRGSKKMVSALDVSRYLLSLDKKRKYFTSKRMSSEEENMIAYRNGAVVEKVSKSFSNELFYLKTFSESENLDPERKKFVEMKFKHFREYSNYELQDLSHDDPSWQLAREKGDNILMSRESHILNY